MKLTRTHISNEFLYVKTDRTKLLEILEVDEHGGGVDVENILPKEYYDIDEKCCQDSTKEVNSSEKLCGATIHKKR